MAHKPSRRPTTGILYEKTNPTVAKKIGSTLEADLTDSDQAMLHIRDEDTAWFGVTKDEDNTVVFQDHGRYASLMAERSSRTRVLRYPALVSFVGQTGAGKSTLIELLVEICASEQMGQVPVVGSSANPDTPTSGDVHLYCDPNSFRDERPILYADCEGLNGGEREPMGAKSRNKVRRDASENRRKTTAFAKYIRRKHDTSQRDISWATDAEKCSREHHVRHLYPRLLYTFSDVIVFVMKEHRTIEKVIEQLIQWAVAVLETSSNQPVLPHAIIVLNASENSTDPALWNVDQSTIALLTSVEQAIHQNHKLREWAEFWRKLEKSIESVESLLLSCYSSIRVVRVPERGRPNLIHQQIKRLYQEIAHAANQSYESKHKIRMLLNSDELQPYLQYAFDHFCRDLDTPFDFVQASFANNPIPSDFGGNILKVAINIMSVWKDRLDGPLIFKELSYLIASCVMLDSARHRTLGPADKVFPEYLEHFDTVLEDFCDRHWPCEYVSQRGRCVNVKAGHNTKGHQLKNGQLLAIGDYESRFTPESYQKTFRNNIFANLEELLERLTSTIKNPNSELQAAANIHRDSILGPFFNHLQGASKFISHTSCLSCLVEPPEHSLPCGHVLCSRCIRSFGTARGRSIIDMRSCPLHEDESQFGARWPVMIKPAEAGVRILSLDGGGIRGIVELKYLQHLEKALGGGLHIQSFIDLTVGTSTGGIIALALGKMNWPVGRCVSTFEKLCDQAFTKRKGIGLPLIDFLVSSSNHSKYRTVPLETALKTAFGDGNLFGGTNTENTAAAMKVGVTTTTTNGTACLLANYNRINVDEGRSYAFQRSEKPKREVKIWEAARATSAAPRIFKPFNHEPSGNVFQDGAIYYNNPIELAMRERRLIWPDQAERDPDIVISIGTCFNPQASRKSIIPASNSRWGMFSHFKQLVKIAADHVQSTLDSEKTWNEFFYNQGMASARIQKRYIRLNLPLNESPPRLDEINAMDQLRDLAEAKFNEHTYREKIKSVADQLLATSFYFERTDDPVFQDDFKSIAITGHIVCRFPPASDEIRDLGIALRKRTRDAYNSYGGVERPHFKIVERKKERDAEQLVVSDEIVDQMIKSGSFSLGRITIRVSDRMAETGISLCFGNRERDPVYYPISGSPLRILEEDRRLTSMTRLSLASLSRRRTPTSTARREGWVMPHCWSQEGIDRYAEHALPGLATEMQISDVERRLAPPPPPVSSNHRLATTWSRERVELPASLAETSRRIDTPAPSELENKRRGRSDQRCDGLDSRTTSPSSGSSILSDHPYSAQPMVHEVDGTSRIVHELPAGY